MLADPRAKSLSDDFAFQWLHLAKLDEIAPGPRQFPHASGLLDLRGLFKEELRLFVDSVLRSERSVMELLTADYTFLNERLAMHYGIETVKGPLPSRDARQHGAPRLAGQGRHPDADRVSQSHLARAAWRVDPRPAARHAADRSAANVPSLPENKRGQPARTLRARLEQHRANARASRVTA